MFVRSLRASLGAMLVCTLCSCDIPAAKAPPAKPAATCTKPSTKGATTVPPWPAGPVAGGVFHASKTGAPISIAAGKPGFDLTQDLVIWVEDDLVVDDSIRSPAFKQKEGINITLMSDGKITVNSTIGGGSVGRAAAAKPPAGTDAYADAGGNGGSVKLIAGSIEIKSGVAVKGQDGGVGGEATADALVIKVPQFTTKKFGGSAEAVSGSGGHGGDVVLCADFIKVGWSGGAGALSGGWGGAAGLAAATSANGKKARARGGDGGLGGDVVFGGGAQLDIGGPVTGGYGGFGVGTVATVTETGDGDAVAAGGNGGKGGTVRFLSGVSTQGLPPQARVASAGIPVAINDGGPATAIAGTPGQGWFQSGGDATATGGHGGQHGDTPQVPVMTPAGIKLVPGTTGKSGRGGPAHATPGSGATTTNGSKGGSSGTGSATGGANGDGVAATGGNPSTPALPPTGSTGGVGTQASQLGAP